MLLMKRRFTSYLGRNAILCCLVALLWACCVAPGMAAGSITAYSASVSGPIGQVADNAGLNIGHTFTARHGDIRVLQLGVYDYNGDGLKAPHLVIFFSNTVNIASVTVPAGTSAPLINGCRFVPLATPLELSAGKYSVVVYQMNGGSASDAYGDISGANNTFNGGADFTDGGSIYEFTTHTSAYPGKGGASLGSSASNLASASFIYEVSSLNPSYIADTTKTTYGGNADNTGLNIGHTFTVGSNAIQILNLGVFDFGGDGLNASHVVTLFTNSAGTYLPIAGGTTTVPAGTAASLAKGFRFAALPAALTLPAGRYAVIAYQMNGGTSSDGYGEANGTSFNGDGYVTDDGFTPYQFTDAASPSYPNTGGSANLACASFDYAPVVDGASHTVAFTASTSGPFGQNGNNTGLNIGNVFTVSGTNILVSNLGVYDYAGNGLASAHTVSLFVQVGTVYAPITGASVEVPAGTNAWLVNSYRFAPLSTPVALPPGKYAVIAYQMNGGAGSDPYSDLSGSNNGFNGGTHLFNGGSLYEFTTSGSPSFPGTGGGNTGTTAGNFGCASLIYSLTSTSSVPVSAPVISPQLTYFNPAESVSLTASAFGSSPITYQWYYGSPLVPIPGATNSVLVLTNLRPIHRMGHAGSYAASAQNALGGPLMSAHPQQVSVAAIPPSTPLRIMPLGDSITYGQGAPGGYRAPLYQSLAGTNFNVKFVGSQKNNPAAWLPSLDHEGHSGYRIDQIQSGFLGWVNSVANPDIILLLIGTNDYGQQYATPSATNRLDRLIWAIATNRPSAKLIVANLVLRTDNSNYENQIQAGFNRFVPAIVSSHAALGHRVSFVDMHSALGASDLIDGLHPNQSGYNKMAAAWQKAILELIPAPGSTNASVMPSGTNCKLTYCGIPQFEYITQRSINLAPGSWLPISTNIAPAAGVFEVVDSFSNLAGAVAGSAFYRLIQQ
jgi:lysophospholipase L1-like esterase